MTRHSLPETESIWNYLQEPPLWIGVGILASFVAVVIYGFSVIGGW